MMGVSSTHATVTSLVGFQDFLFNSLIHTFGLRLLHREAKQDGSVQNENHLVGASTGFLRKYLQHQ